MAEMSRCEEGLSHDRMSEIMQKYETDRLLVSTAYADAGTEFLRARLEGALINQMDGGGEAFNARSAIWANTVRDNIIAGMNALKAGKAEEGFSHLVQAANSLSAYADAQAFLDPFGLGDRV